MRLFRILAALLIAVVMHAALAGGAHAQGISYDPVAYGSTSSASVQRPAGVQTYTVNTAWANAASGATYLTFPLVCRLPGSQVVPYELTVQLNSNQTTKLTGILWLFDAPPTAPINDNATFSIATADLAHIVGQIPFSVSTVINQGSGASGATFDDETQLGKKLKCGATQNLYAMPQVTNAYVTTGAEILQFTLQSIGIN